MQDKDFKIFKIFIQIDILIIFSLIILDI